MLYLGSMRRTTNILITFVLILISRNSIAQLITPPVPDNLYSYQFDAISTGNAGYYLATPTKLFIQPSDPNFISPYPVIFDQDGYIAWYSKPLINNAIDFKFFGDVQRYVYTYIQQGQVRALIMDADFIPVDTIVTQATRDVHDLQRTSNGNWILATAYFDTMDLSMYTFNGTVGSANTVVKGFGYEEYDGNWNLINQWNSNDHIAPTETYDFWGYNSNPFDYCHGNAIEEDLDGNLLISYRHLNAIHKIDRSTGDIIWRLGGELSDFTFVNDPGFSGQHDIRVVGPNEYSIFDNDNMNGNTRGIVYQVDTLNHTAEVTSQYVHPGGNTSTAMGNFQTIPGEGYILSYGMIFRPYSSAVILDASFNKQAEFFFEDSVVTYRMMKFDLPFPERPQIDCSFNGTNWELSVPDTFSTYLWSNGAATNTINLTQAGTYQVWVDYGSGMLGSLPLVITDVNNPCSLHTDEITQTKEGTYTYYTVLGQQVDIPEPNAVYIKVWSNGKVERVFFVN